MQLEVLWNLLLQAGSEGPTLISCAASWRTLSSAGDFHPHALAEPDVTVSRHTAPIVQPQAEACGFALLKGSSHCWLAIS